MMQHHRVPGAVRPLAGEDWRPRAACRVTDRELLFPVSDSGKCLAQRPRRKRSARSGANAWRSPSGHGRTTECGMA